MTEYKYGKALDKSGNAVYYVLSDGTEEALPTKDLASVKYSGYSRYEQVHRRLLLVIRDIRQLIQ